DSGAGPALRPDARTRPLLSLPPRLSASFHINLSFPRKQESNDHGSPFALNPRVRVYLFDRIEGRYFGGSGAVPGRRPIHSTTASGCRAGSETTLGPSRPAISAAFSCSAFGGSLPASRTTSAIPCTWSRCRGAAR